MSNAMRSVILVSLLLTLLAGSASAIGHSHTRDGWVYALNLGWGWAKVTGHDTGNNLDMSSDWADDFTGGLRVGFAGSDNFSYGLDFSGWSDYGYQTRIKTWRILVTGTWYPKGQGFYLRGGIGGGSLGLEYTPVGFPKISQSAGGLALGAGAGWEVRVSPGVAVGLAYDYYVVDSGTISYLDDVKTQTQGLTFSITWYTD